MLGLGAASVLPLAGHRVFEGNTAANLGHPLWSARGFVRLCVRTVTGRDKGSERKTAAKLLK